MKPILLALAILFPGFLFSQDLILTNGQKSIKFKTGSFVRILIPSKTIEPCATCSGDYMTGKIVSFRDQVLTLDVVKTGQIISEDGKVIGHADFTYSRNSENRTITIPANEILSVTQQGKKKYKTTSTGQVIGQVSTILGIGHLVSIPFADENKDVLAVVGLSELVLGIILATSLDEKEYITSINCPSKSPSPDKIWKLN
jgi:hypothetical protein